MSATLDTKTEKKPYRFNPTAIAIAPPATTLPPSVLSVPSVLSGQGSDDSRPEMELIRESGLLIALLLPREVTQAQLLIAELVLPVHFVQSPQLTRQWKQWRVYCAPFWALSKSVFSPKPTGPKLFFA
jgi:hypothetical protein